jgi:hypothetical protein
MPLLGDLPQLLKRLRATLLPLGLPPLKLYQLPINLLQLPSLSRKRMPTLTALLSLAGHCCEALRAYLHRWRLLPVALS